MYISRNRWSLVSNGTHFETRIDLSTLSKYLIFYYYTSLVGIYLLIRGSIAMFFVAIVFMITREFTVIYTTLFSSYMGTKVHIYGIGGNEPTGRFLKYFAKSGFNKMTTNKIEE